MIVRPTARLDDIKAVLSHPVIWDAITCDGVPPPELFDWSKYDNWLSIGGYVDDQPIAIMMFHGFMDGDKTHIHVLPEYRKRYAREFGEKALEFAQPPIYADIPEIYENVRRFTESFGFKCIGLFPSNKTKNGNGCQIARYVRYQS